MSTSVAQCLRAVFAAFMWHEGIVHDAMACASFLKFHPNLPKVTPKVKVKDTERSATSSRISTPSSSRLGTPSSTPSGSLKKHSRQSSGSSASEVYANINEALKSVDIARSGKDRERKDSKSLERHKEKAARKERANSESESSSRDKGGDERKERSYSDVKADTMSIESGSLDRSSLDRSTLDRSSLEKDAKTKEEDLPPTLQHLVSFWEELSAQTHRIVTKNLIMPSPALSAKSKSKNDKKERDKSDKSEKKSKKKKADMKYANAAPRGNLFGEAAAGMFGGGGDRESLCELCGGMFSHPVTYHMKQVHPGCGKHAGGQGYNSGGNFCGGWAGNCGDGGIGGSTWYLMCDRCREKYMKDRRQASKQKDKKVKKKSTPVRQPAPPQPLDPHLLMKNNAMFLLDLASAAGISLPNRPSSASPSKPTGFSHASPVTSRTSTESSMLPSVSEDNPTPAHEEQSPFPAVQFLYLRQRGAADADSVFAEELVFSGVAGEVTLRRRRHQGLSTSGHDASSPVQRSVSGVGDVNYRHSHHVSYYTVCLHLK